MPGVIEHRFPRKLVRGGIVRKVNRFIAEVRLGRREKAFAHIPHTGRLPELLAPGRECWLDPVGASASRWTEYTLTLVRAANGQLACVDTGVPNRLARSAAKAGALASLPGYLYEAHEVSWGDSRVDLMLRSPAGRKLALVEVKSVTWVVDGCALFPDAPSVRGAKHLHNLAAAKARGFRALQLYVVQRADGRWFAPASFVDPGYIEAAAEARRQGVEFAALWCEVWDDRVALGGKLPVRLRPVGGRIVRKALANALN